MTDDEIKSDLITPRELVERYRRCISERTLANWRSNGEGPRFVKIGGRVMYSLAAVMDWEKTRASRIV